MNWIYLLVAIVFFYIMFSPRFAAWLYRPMLFPRLPMVAPGECPTIAGIKGKAVNFVQADGNVLWAWFFRNADSHYTMLVSHGNLGNIQTHNYLTEGLLRAGNSVFIYDYSGYGASTGLPDLSNVTRDAQAAYDYLIESEHLSPDNIILYGESIGAAIAAHLATVRKARAVICQSGFASLRKIATEKMPLLHCYPKLLFSDHFLHTLNSLRNVEIPVLIMHGEKDTLVSFQHAELLFAAANVPKKLIPFSDTGHKDIVFARPEYFIDTLETFLKSLPEKID